MPKRPDGMSEIVEDPIAIKMMTALRDRRHLSNQQLMELMPAGAHCEAIIDSLVKLGLIEQYCEDIRPSTRAYQLSAKGKETLESKW